MDYFVKHKDLTIHRIYDKRLLYQVTLIAKT